MSADEMRQLLEESGLSQRALSYYAQRDESHTRKQARGREPIDAPLATFLRKLHKVLIKPPAKPLPPAVDGVGPMQDGDDDQVAHP